MIVSRPLRLSLAALAVTLPSHAFAATFSLDQVLGTFNAVTQSYTGTQEIEGRTFIDGDLSGVTGQFGFKVTDDGLDFSNLYVTGDLINSTINLSAGGVATVGGDASTSQVFNGTLEAGSTDFPDIDFAALAAESLFLSGLSGTAADVADQNNKSFGGTGNATQGEGTFAANSVILDVALSDLASGGYSIDYDVDSTIIINVSGTNGSFGMNPLGGIAGAENVIWNFYEAQFINVNSPIQGHILAPLAAMSGFTGSTEGTVIAKSINLTNGELHTRAWAGTVPEPLETDNPAAVPLPAGLPLMLGAIGALLLGRRRA